MDPYNILLITDDQHRWDCLGIEGHPTIQTPHLDQLAREGTRFTSAYSDCPVCIPARGSLISGQYAATYGKPHFFRGEPFPIDIERTMMSLLTQAGYQTQAVGKMHFYPERACYGFENMILDIDYVEEMDLYSEYKEQLLSKGMGLNEVWPVRSAVPAHQTLTAWTVNQSIRFLKRRDPTRPFFLWTSFFKPHPPFDPPEPYDTMYDNMAIPEPAMGDWIHDAPFAQRLHREAAKFDLIAPEMIRKIRKAYYGLITEIDHQLGRLFGYMMRYGLYRNTLILFTSDHGDMLGDHLDLGKTTHYEGSAHVPFLMRFPDGYQCVEKGSVVDKPIALVDILPTLVEFAGGTVPNDIDGRSLLPLARNNEAPWRPWVPLEIGAGKGQFGLTDGQWKYLWFRWEGREQLFHLDSDPYENRDLAGDPAHRPQLETWRNHLIEHLSARERDVTDGTTLLSSGGEYPGEREVRSRNPHGWYHNYPWSRASEH